MVGRITKRKGIYYCTVRGRTFLVEIDTDQKINNGDLVLLNTQLSCKTNSLKVSGLTVMKRVSSKTKYVDIDETTPLFHRLENRILDLRRPASWKIFMTRSEVNRILAIIFYKNGYINVNTPLIVGSMLEGRVKTFDINYFGKEASLTMTKLVHLRYLICSDYEKVYDLSPVFVGGQHKTSSHVVEYYTFDWASSEKSDYINQLQFVDQVLSKLLSKLSQPTLNIDNNVDTRTLLNEIEKVKFVTYDELIDSYSEISLDNKKVTEQFHLPKKVVDYAHKTYGKYLWITEFPEEFKQFYCDTKVRDGRNVVLASELWWNGIKVASVSFSNSDYEKIRNRIKFLGLDPKNFKVYLDSIQLGSSEAYLGSLYIERLMMVLLNIDNMKETLMFPRAAQGTVLDP